MGLIKRVTRAFNPALSETVISCTLSDAVDLYIHRRLLDDVVQEITAVLAKAYVEQHGAEILKRIEEKTIDARLIQKVVAKLREELKGDRSSTSF